MSRRGGTRYANDAAIFVGILLAIGAAVMLAMPGGDAEDAGLPTAETPASEGAAESSAY